MLVPAQPEILPKSLNVNVCRDLLMFAGPQLTAIPNIRNDLQHDRASVKAKGEKRFWWQRPAMVPKSCRSMPLPTSLTGCANSLNCGLIPQRPLHRILQPTLVALTINSLHLALRHPLDHCRRLSVKKSLLLPLPPFLSTLHSHCLSNRLRWTFVGPCHFRWTQRTVCRKSVGVGWTWLDSTASPAKVQWKSTQTT